MRPEVLVIPDHPAPLDVRVVPVNQEVGVWLDSPDLWVLLEQLDKQDSPVIVETLDRKDLLVSPAILVDLESVDSQVT